MTGAERLTPSAARARLSWETLATPGPAASRGTPKGKALEDNMVAATEKILKISKMMPKNMQWSGDFNTLAEFCQMLYEWVDIKLGAYR